MKPFATEGALTRKFNLNKVPKSMTLQNFIKFLTRELAPQLAKLPGCLIRVRNDNGEQLSSSTTSLGELCSLPNILSLFYEGVVDEEVAAPAAALPAPPPAPPPAAAAPPAVPAAEGKAVRIEQGATKNVEKAGAEVEDVQQDQLAVEFVDGVLDFEQLEQDPAHQPMDNTVYEWEFFGLDGEDEPIVQRAKRGDVVFKEGAQCSYAIFEQFLPATLGEGCLGPPLPKCAC
jgi:hypothetical protein